MRSIYVASASSFLALMLPLCAHAYDQGEAYGLCQDALAKISGSQITNIRCIHRPVSQSQGRYDPSWTYQGNDYSNPGFSYDSSCSSRSEQTGWAGDSEFVCYNGCTYKGYRDPVVGVFFSTFDTASNQQLDVCSTSSTTPAPTTGGGDDGGGTGGETGGGDGNGDGGSGGDGGDDGGSGGDDGGGDGGDGGDGGGDGNDDGGGDDDGDGGGDGESPSLPENPTYPGDVPMPYADPAIPATYTGQWSSGLGNGSCPSPKSVSVGLAGFSTTLEFSFKPLCDFASMIRGLVIACASIAAAYIILGVRK